MHTELADPLTLSFNIKLQHKLSWLVDCKLDRALVNYVNSGSPTSFYLLWSTWPADWCPPPVLVPDIPLCLQKEIISITDWD
jgi:hypothetical protein